MRSRFLSVFLTLILVLAGNSAVADTSRPIDIAFISWAGAKPSSVNAAEIQRTVQDEVINEWQRLTTFEGSSESTSIQFSLGLTLSEPINLSRPMSCDSSSSSTFMNSIRQETYKRLGIESFNKRYLLIVAPDAGCLWLGKALLGGPNSGGVVTLQNTASAFVISHELGHTLGLGHTNLLRCNSGAKDGPWGTDCKAVEYGGTIDIMGNISTKSRLTSYHLWRMGLMKSEEIHQNWLPETVVLNAVDVAGEKRSIFFRDGDSAYWLEYRRASAENSYIPGLVLYRTDPPPSNAILSINPDDSLGAPSDQSITTDIWMLNLGNYVYSISPTRASGSMTLETGKSTQTFTGNISISSRPGPTANSIEVQIARKADTFAPPNPALTDKSTWRFADSPLISSNYQDKESTIEKFEIKIGSTVSELKGTDSNNWSPTYLNPLSPPKTLRVKDLPEGSYSFQIRAVDIWGNASAWSDSADIVVDRGYPIGTESLKLNSISSNSVSITFPEIRDLGSGLCESVMASPQGWVFSRDSAKSAPTFNINLSSVTSGTFNVFDCNGNGISRSFTLNGSNAMAEKAKKTGKWSAAGANYPQGALRCRGKCTLSISLSGEQNVLVGPGSGEILANRVQLAKISGSTSNQIRVIEKLNLGARSRVVRVVAQDLVVIGFSNARFEFSKASEVQLEPNVVDPSLIDPNQKSLARFGFNSSDFTNDWLVLPMARGTTLQDPTLDLCEASYPSESEREFRRQLQANSKNSKYSFLSSEVVQYKSESGAKNALAELKKAAEECQRNGGGLNRAGIKVPYEFKPAPVSLLKFVPVENRVFVHTRIGSGDSARWLLGFYQFSGRIFSGLYVVKNGTTDFSSEEIKVWLDAASRLAARMTS